MTSFLLIGRTVGPEGGFEFRWRDENGVLPNDDERVSLIADMQREHHDVFHRNCQRHALVVLPAWDDEKLYKLASWREGAFAGRHGLNVIEDLTGPCHRCGKDYDEHPGGYCPDQVGGDGMVYVETAQEYVPISEGERSGCGQDV